MRASIYHSNSFLTQPSSVNTSCITSGFDFSEPHIHPCQAFYTSHYRQCFFWIWISLDLILYVFYIWGDLEFLAHWELKWIIFFFFNLVNSIQPVHNAEDLFCFPVSCVILWNFEWTGWWLHVLALHWTYYLHLNLEMRFRLLKWFDLNYTVCLEQCLFKVFIKS